MPDFYRLDVDQSLAEIQTRYEGLTDAEVAARAAVENLRAYAAASGFEWATEDAEPLGIVLAAAFPKLSSQQLGDLIAPILAEPGA